MSCYQALFQHAKEHEMTLKELQLTQIKWWNCNSNSHRLKSVHSNTGKVTAKKPNYKGTQGKSCSTPHPLRGCPAWGKKCHKCRNKTYFSTCCRLKLKGPQDNKRPPRGRSMMRCLRGRGRQSQVEIQKQIKHPKCP